MKWALAAGAAGYAVLFLFPAFFADALIFRPPAPGYRDDGTILKLRTADGVRISARYLPNAKARHTLLYSHGKREDLATIRPFLERLEGWGFSVFAYDYHGYGTSEGQPSEENVYRDIDAAYDYLTTVARIPPERIIVSGHSLGTGPSVDLAARRQVGGLILDSGFTSAFRVVTQVPLPPFDRFRNLDKLGRVHCPILVIHRRHDEVVPFQHGEALYEAANEPKQHEWMDQGKHEAIYEGLGEEYGEVLRGFCDGIATGDTDEHG